MPPRFILQCRLNIIPVLSQVVPRNARTNSKINNHNNYNMNDDDEDDNNNKNNNKSTTTKGTKKTFIINHQRNEVKCTRTNEQLTWYASAQNRLPRRGNLQEMQML